MGLKWAEDTIEIAATPEEVFDAITDYESFHDWQSAVISADVLETDKKSKLGELVSYDIDAKIRTIHYTLRYRYDRPESITWDFIKGDGINQMDGGYEIRASGSGTAATYKVGVDVTGVPGPLLKRAQKSTVKKANEDLKAEAERRHAAGGGSKPGSDHAEQATAEQPTYSGGPSHPFDMLPGPLNEVAKLPGKIMVRVGKRLGG